MTKFLHCERKENSRKRKIQTLRILLARKTETVRYSKGGPIIKHFVPRDIPMNKTFVGVKGNFTGTFMTLEVV